MPNELAIATSISSNPSAYIVVLIFERIVRFKRIKHQFVQAFVNRLLVEKPDFHKTPEVGWALIALYSLHFGAVLESKRQLELFLTDSMAPEFDILGSMIHERVPIHEVKTLYQIIQKDEAIDGVIVLTMEKRSHFLKDNLPKYYRSFWDKLPSRLRVREKLLETKEANKSIQRTRKLAADF